MIKALVGFALLLVAIGTGLSLYLPKYKQIPAQASFEVPFNVIEGTLEQPIDFSSISPSTELLAGNEAPIAYALQIGVYGNLHDAKFGLKELSNKLEDLLAPPIIFKTALDQREWFIVAIGPFVSEEQRRKYQRELKNSQTILWPSEASP